MWWPVEACGDLSGGLEGWPGVVARSVGQEYWPGVVAWSGALGPRVRTRFTSVFCVGHNIGLDS